MENSPYNSLKNQLIQNGIINSPVSDASAEHENFFNQKEIKDENLKKDAPETSNPVFSSNKRRLNRFEFEGENTNIQNNNIIALLKDKKLSKTEKFLIRFFPKYIKQDLQKMLFKN